MKKYILRASLLLAVSLSLTSCEVIGGIFKTGFGIGIFISVLVVAAVIYIISKFSKK